MAPDKTTKDENVIQTLESLMPPIKLIKLRSEADYYGASYLIGEKLGMTDPPRSAARWQHGWIYEPISHFRQISDFQRSGLKLVATENHASILREAGLKAVATGLAFLYTEPPTVERIPSSLLVMPAHVTKHSKHSYDEMTYVDEICSVKDQFTHVVACISQQCIDKGYWSKSFDSAGIPWIAGAGAYDANALRRMRILFSSFDYVTSNAIGSHLVYSAYSGCRVSLFGPTQSFEASDLENEPFYRLHPELVPLAVERTGIESIRKHYPHFCCEPQNAQPCVDWAFRELGGEYMRSPEEMFRLLGWGFSQQSLLYAKRQVLGIFNRANQIVTKRNKKKHETT